METLGEEDHDVGKLLHLVADVAVGDFAEAEGRDALPHLEGLPDGLVSLVLAHLRCVVLNAGPAAGSGSEYARERDNAET